MAMTFTDFIIWVIIPLMNYLAWNQIGLRYGMKFDFLHQNPGGQGDSAGDCEEFLSSLNIHKPPKPQTPIRNASVEAFKCPEYSTIEREYSSPFSRDGPIQLKSIIEYDKVNAMKFNEFRKGEFAMVKYQSSYSILLNPRRGQECSKITTLSVGMKVPSCIGVAFADVDYPLNLVRYNSEFKRLKHDYNAMLPEPSGYFSHVATPKGRLKMKDKLVPFFAHLKDIEKMVVSRLEERNIRPGDDVVVMVSNDGEADLFLNFACSCSSHNIPLRNVILFAASLELAHLVDGTGAIGIHHPKLGAVSPGASRGYLDKTFVDMMWYKAFSVWLMLKLGYNMLFQDLDIVWFTEPFSHIKKLLSENAENGHEYVGALSDDGQRSLRYTPFFANSGFYYLKSEPSNIYLTWMIMMSYDQLTATGSHQNVYTMKLQEVMDLSTKKRKFLDMNEFPAGLKYHHDKPFMAAMMNHTKLPYMFHMCWTANKGQKLDYLSKAKMWYLGPYCTEKTLISKGSIFKEFSTKVSQEQEKGQWSNYLHSKCCEFTGRI